MPVWSQEALDLVQPAHLEIEDDRQGSLVFIAVSAGLEYFVLERDGHPAIEFSFFGRSEGDDIFGRGWALIEGAELRGHLYIFGSEDSPFHARRE